LRTVLGWHARALDRELCTLADETPSVLPAAVPPLGDGGPELFAADGLHPSAAAYRQWAAELARVVAPG
jgi:lysophospholipase L1-like esterase